MCQNSGLLQTIFSLLYDALFSVCLSDADCVENTESILIITVHRGGRRHGGSNCSGFAVDEFDFSQNTRYSAAAARIE